VSKNYCLLICLFLFSFYPVFLFGSEYPNAGISLDKYLPGNFESDGWRKNNDFQQFKGEDLYLYMNGGAKVYHEYGFRQMIVQEYINKNGKSISLEIFEMADDKSAYGIYTFKTSYPGQQIRVGDQGRLEDYYLNFWKGNFLVTITAFDPSQEAREGLILIAQAVDRKIKDKGKIPSLVFMLSKKNLELQSIKYFKGNLGLYNIYPFFARHIFGFKEGVKGDYRDKYSIVICDYNSPGKSRIKYREIKESWRGSLKEEKFSEVSKDLFQIQDSKNRLMVVGSLGKYIVAILNISSFRKAMEILTAISGKIEKKL